MNSNSSNQKGWNAHSGELPVLVATTLPVDVTTYQTVSIDGPVENEATPLVTTVYSGDAEAVESDDQRNWKVPAPVGPVFRDRIFAIVFLVQFAMVMFVANTYSPQGYQNMDQFMNYTFIRDQIISSSDDMTPDKIAQFDSFVDKVEQYLEVYPSRILMWCILPSAIFAFAILHGGLVYVVQPLSTFIVTSSLVCTVGGTALLLLVWVISEPSTFTIIVSLLILCIVVHYVKLVWPIIPFASVNLKVALRGIGDNSGTYLLAFCSCELAIVWTIYWFYVTGGAISYLDSQCPSDGNDLSTTTARLLLGDATTATPPPTSSTHIESDNEQGCGQIWYFLLLVLSGFWTTKVLLNLVQVTVAGVMGTWCYDRSSASGCCSSAVASSLYRSVTYSFGSICFGSLLQGLMKCLRAVIPDRSRRNNDQSCGLCFCLSECGGRVLEDVFDYFNQWAYVFVGVYGYPYCESGKRALELFRSKGWTSIITERLASYVMTCITFLLGAITGVGAFLVTMAVDKWHADDEGAPDSTSFVFGIISPKASLVIGFLVGSVVSAVMMSVVRGGVNTLIVCFADSPTKLEENHPELTKEMIDAWSEAFPETIHKSAFEPPRADPVPATLY